MKRHGVMGMMKINKTNTQAQEIPAEEFPIVPSGNPVHAPSLIAPVIFTRLAEQKVEILKDGFHSQGTASMAKVR